MRRLVGAVLALLLLAAGGASIAGPALAASDLSVASSTALSARLQEYVVSSPALGADVTVRVQLPSGYAADPAKRWPMALLLHGRSEDATTWSERTDLEQFDAMVVVMPDGGQVGWYTDWYDDSCCGAQRWESFHIGELLPWAERTFRLAPGRSQRFVAGDSMGGFGAMSYAARHPGLFAGAAELSGFVDTMLAEVSGTIGVDAQSFQVAGVPPGSVFGPVATEEVRWRGHNPVDLAANLADTDLVLRHGNGLPGEYGGSPDAGEAAIRLTGVSFHERLSALGIEHRWDDYGNGTHIWPYWEEGLRITWPRWLAIAEADAPPPQSFSYRSMEPRWSVYGWDVALSRDVLEFATLEVASPAALTLRGSGVATVTSPASYRPGASYVVTSSTGTEATIVRAGTDGRLTFSVDLGPSHTAQQYTPRARLEEAALGPAYFTSADVTITPAAPTAPAQPEAPGVPGVSPAREGVALAATGLDRAPAVLGGLVLVGALAVLRAASSRGRRRAH